MLKVFKEVSCAIVSGKVEISFPNKLKFSNEAKSPMESGSVEMVLIGGRNPLK